jgi:hypothetical protein
MCHQATKPENMNPQKVFALFSLAGFVSLMTTSSVRWSSDGFGEE